MIISSLTTKYRDLAMVVGFGVSLWSYCSPVAYDMFSRSQLAPGSAVYYIYMLNPVTPAINLFRNAYLGCGEVDWLFYGISWITTIAVAFVGALMFSKSEKTFMDTV
jgi:lipopolysaccharide transport system permease protein